MEQKRIKVRLTENSPYSEYGYYKRGDIGYIDGYVSGCAVIILENGKFAKAELRWIEVVNEEDKNTNTELKESEDEKIRKSIINLVIKSAQNGGMALHKWESQQMLAWLEKQGEQIDIANKEYWRGYREGKQEVLDKYTELEKQGEQKPQRMISAGAKEAMYDKPAEWNEEDESHIRYLIECLENCKKGVALMMTTSTAQEYINWLKSLRPQKQWKPTEEQVEALGYAIKLCDGEGEKGRYYLQFLYKLMNDFKAL